VPPLPPLSKTAKWTLFIQVTGGPLCQTSFYTQYSGNLSGADAATLLTTLGSSWGTHFAPITATPYQLALVRVIDLNSQSGVVVQQAAVHTGSAAGTPLTAGTALVLSAKIPYRFRGGHPRVYIVGMPQSDLADSNTWNATFLPTVATAWTSLLADMNALAITNVGTLQYIYWHTHSSNKADFPGGVPTTKPPWPLATPVPHLISSWNANPQVASQRRRNQQGGG
jgi:hypothetical protein